MNRTLFKRRLLEAAVHIMLVLVSLWLIFWNPLRKSMQKLVIYNKMSCGMRHLQLNTLNIAEHTLQDDEPV